MLEDVRLNLDDYSDGLCKGTETGKVENIVIVRKLNEAQKYLFNLLFAEMPELFLNEVSVTGSSGVYTIPTDVHKLDSIMDSGNHIIRPINIQLKKVTSTSGSDHLYYRKGNALVSDSGSSDAVTFNYYKTVKDLTQGVSAGGTATSITLAATANKTADYYNNIVIENVTDGWADTITDYTTTRIATIATRCTLGKYYGTVSELPEIFHPLIPQKATILLKNRVNSPQRPELGEQSDFAEQLRETLKSFAGSKNDVSMDELMFDDSVFM
jgi:hypothetical protein